MTDKREPIVPKGSADLPLEERRRLQREQEKEIREGITRRHLHLRTEECALDRRG